MRIIDLLNKIANGEEVPKNVEYDDDVYEYDYDEKNYGHFFIDHYNYLFDENIMQILDDEIEILEEEKKIPEKLSTWYSVEVKQSDEENIEFANYNFETMYEKINEICDYLKSKGE